MLSLAYNQVSDVSPLAGITSLQSVYLQDNLITNLQPLTNVRLVDNSDSGFSTAGTGWSTVSSSAAVEGSYEDNAGTGTSSATWQFSGVPQGYYDVETTWTATANFTSQATYTVTSGAGSFQASVNQTLAPAPQSGPDTWYALGQPWKSLGTVSVTSSGSVTVNLPSSASGSVEADAIRLVRVQSNNYQSVLVPLSNLSTVTITGNPLNNEAQDIFAPSLANAAAHHDVTINTNTGTITINNVVQTASTFYGTPFTVSLGTSANPITTFYVDGDLNIGPDTITVTGSYALSIVVGDNVTISPNAVFNDSASGASPGPGGGVGAQPQVATQGQGQGGSGGEGSYTSGGTPLPNPYRGATYIAGENGGAGGTGSSSSGGEGIPGVAAAPVLAARTTLAAVPEVCQLTRRITDQVRAAVRVEQEGREVVLNHIQIMLTMGARAVRVLMGPMEIAEQ